MVSSSIWKWFARVSFSENTEIVPTSFPGLLALGTRLKLYELYQWVQFQLIEKPHKYKLITNRTSQNRMITY